MKFDRESYKQKTHKTDFLRILIEFLRKFNAVVQTGCSNNHRFAEFLQLTDWPKMTYRPIGYTTVVLLSFTDLYLRICKTRQKKNSLDDLQVNFKMLQDRLFCG
jgi:hypothetical protein